ncbi:unnamed protein product [Discosporangium mesarthrocarpum]
MISPPHLLPASILTLRSKWVNLLLLVVPLASVSLSLGWSETVIFVVNFVAMIPLAATLGDFTEVR